MQPSIHKKHSVSEKVLVARTVGLAPVLRQRLRRHQRGPRVSQKRVAWLFRPIHAVLEFVASAPRFTFLRKNSVLCHARIP
jgi:hypothetical protein